MSDPIRLTAHARKDDYLGRRAELAYLQKRIQEQTPMVVMLEDGQRLEGVIEWFDRDAIKLRGRARTLVYKAAILSMHKAADERR